MKWQLSLAAFSLGYRAVEFVTWFESLVRGCLQSSSENDGPCHATDTRTNFDDTRLRKLEVEIHRLLYLLMTSECADQLSARAEHAIDVVDRTFILCLRLGQGSLLGSETQAELENSLRWLEESRGEANVKTWRGQSRKVSETIRGIISDFTVCFAEISHAFSDELRCFYELGRGIARSQGMLPILQDVANNSLKHRRMVREKLYPSILKLVKNCEVYSPPFSMKLDEKIDDRNYLEFLFALQEAIETQLTRRAKQESVRAKTKKAVQASTTGSGETDTPATGTSTMSDATDERNRLNTESPTISESDTHDVSAAKLIDAQLLSHSESKSVTHRPSQKQAQAPPHDNSEMQVRNRPHQRFEEVDHGVMIHGVLVPVADILKRGLVVLGTATHSAEDAQLRRAIAKRGAKKPSNAHVRSQRLSQLRNILRSEFKLPKTADPIPRIPQSNPPKWGLDWQLLGDAALLLRPDK